MKLFTKALVCAGALTLTFAAEARVKRVRCESISHNYKECYVGGEISDAELDQQLSSASCRRGRSWGFSRYDDYIWVDDGCRGIFSVWVHDRNHEEP